MEFDLSRSHPINRTGKSDLIFKLARLALARGRSITIGSNDPGAYYYDLRERFPDVMIVLEKHKITIVGTKNGHSQNSIA